MSLGGRTGLQGHRGIDMRVLRACVVLALAYPLAGYTQSPPAEDPAVTAMNAEAARLAADTALRTARAANIAARYGAAPDAPDGTITGPEKLTALPHWVLSETLSTTARTIKADLKEQLVSKCGYPGEKVENPKLNTILVTSTADTRAATAAARLIESQLKRFTKELGGGTQAGGDVEEYALPLTDVAGAIKGVVGTLESLVGLFRADYTIADSTPTVDNLMLRLAVAQELRN